MEATFVVGEHSFAHLGRQNDDLPALRAFVNLLDEARQQGEVLAWEEIFSLPVGQYETLSEYLFGTHRALDRDVRLLLGVQLDRAVPWGEGAGSPPYALTDGSRTLEFAPSVGLCMLRALDDPWVVLCVPGGPFVGACEIREVGDGEGPGRVWFIDAPSTLRRFWRDSFVRYSASIEDVMDAAAYAFPQSVFAPGIWGQANRFDGAWGDVRERLIIALGGLDDGAVQTFEECTQSHERIAQMWSIHRVNCSPESPQTHRNAKAMKQREAQFQDGPRMCEWHAKLEPHRNRVHYAVENGRVYVGIFVDHLL